MKNICIRIFTKIIFAMLLVVFVSSYAFAHCDTMDGPVVKDAKVALEKGDVSPVLKWVKEDAEPQVRLAFQETMAERIKSPESKEATDKRFFETLIRMHRAGEGASFSGLKPEGSVEPIIAEADEAIESGSIEGLREEISEHLAYGLKERFERVLEKSNHKDDSVEAGREYVEAYVEYTHYVEGLHKAMSGGGGHHDEKDE